MLLEIVFAGAVSIFGSDFEAPYRTPPQAIVLVNKHRADVGLPPLISDMALSSLALERVRYLGEHFYRLYYDRVIELINSGMNSTSAARQAAYIAGHFTNVCGPERVFSPDEDCPNINAHERLQDLGYSGGENVALYARSLAHADEQLQASGSHRGVRLRANSTAFGAAIFLYFSGSDEDLGDDIYIYIEYVAHPDRK